jgi:8-oxo-dGTP pyrophosphatase MutT (NUDIX family)
MNEAPPTKPAATLVLLRPEAQGFSVLLMKRPSRSSFMGGMHVFPGGKVEEEDFPGAASLVGEALAERMCLAAAQCEGYAVAACRETFEEMGLLVSNAQLAAAELRSVRQAMETGETKWHVWPHSGLQETRLVYFDHWITPVIEPKRFDTRFFAAAVPADAEPEPNAESISWGFYSPQQALAMIDAGEMAMAPPTLVTMLRLARYNSVDEALTALSQREVGPLQPELAGSDPITLSLPGHPTHSQKERVADNPVAMVMQGNGRWDIIWE